MNMALSSMILTILNKAKLVKNKTSYNDHGLTKNNAKNYEQGLHETHIMKKALSSMRLKIMNILSRVRLHIMNDTILCQDFIMILKIMNKAFSSIIQG